MRANSEHPTAAELPVSEDPAPERLDAEEFTDWIRPHLTAMARTAAIVANSGDRDDVVQESATAAWQARARFDPHYGSARAWLVAITANQARKRIRWSRQPTDHSRQESTEGLLDHGLDLRRAIRRLPKRQRFAVWLYYYVDLPIADVAAVMKCAPGTVKSALSAARQSLRNALGEDYSWMK